MTPGEEYIWIEKHAFRCEEVTLHQCPPLLHPHPFFPWAYFWTITTRNTVLSSKTAQRLINLSLTVIFSFYLYTRTISNSIFFYPVKFPIFNDSKSTEEMAELLLLSRRGKQWWVFHHQHIDTYAGSLFSEAVIIPTLSRSITLHCSHYGTCQPAMILYYNGIDLVEGLAPNEQCCEDHRPSTGAGFTLKWTLVAHSMSIQRFTLSVAEMRDVKQPWSPFTVN